MPDETTGTFKIIVIQWLYIIIIIRVLQIVIEKSILNNIIAIYKTYIMFFGKRKVGWHI